MHKANLDIYLNNPVGIGEHPQHFEEMDKLVESMTSAQDKLEVLNEEYPQIYKNTLINNNEGVSMVTVVVKNGNVERAMRTLKKKLQKEGLLKELKQRQYFEKPSAKKKKEKAEGIKRYQRNLKKKMERLGY